MKKLIVFAALMSVAGAGYAQTDKQDKRIATATERTFNIDQSKVNHRHIVTLQKNNKMVIEMTDAMDYELLNNLDSILTMFQNDIIFYHDSLTTEGNVRIDYALNLIDDRNIHPGANDILKEMRFKKYPPDGIIFLNKSGDLSKLKLEQDTVRIILNKPFNAKGYTINPINYPTQVTFYLNNYDDIVAIANDKQMLHHIIDTLFKSVKSGHDKMIILDGYQTTIHYNPYDKNPVLTKQYGITDDKGEIVFKGENDMLGLQFEFGAGLVRNTLAPMTELGLTIQHKPKELPGQRLYEPSYNIYGVSVSAYYFFEKNQSEYFVKDNWFVNAEIGASVDKKRNWEKSATFGVGYLFRSKGDYFKGTTFKAFGNFQVSKYVTLSPELIFTNNFKQIFPGITVKLF